MSDIKVLKAEIEDIKKRNSRVEADKAWETSGSRKVMVAICTYVVIVSFFYIAGLPNPLVNSVVPALAFILSTLTLSVFKKLWIKRVYKA